MTIPTISRTTQFLPAGEALPKVEDPPNRTTALSMDLRNRSRTTPKSAPTATNLTAQRNTSRALPLLPSQLQNQISLRSLSLSTSVNKTPSSAKSIAASANALSISLPNTIFPSPSRLGNDELSHLLIENGPNGRIYLRDWRRRDVFLRDYCMMGRLSRWLRCWRTVWRCDMRVHI